MKKQNNIIGVLALILVLIMIISGCNKNKEKIPMTDSTENVATEEGRTDSDNQKIKEVSVNSVEQLLEAIGPDTDIYIEPGYYNLTDYIDELYIKEGEQFNKSHKYVELREVHDGVELVIQNTDNMNLRCEMDYLTDIEIVVEPRYASVVCFENCNNIKLSYLDMKHTDTGTCSGNVIDFFGCQNVYLDYMRLDGCGDCGIGAFDGTGEMYVTFTDITHCESGPFYIENAKGNIEFEECCFYYSNGGGYYSDTEQSDLTFIKSSFDQQETNRWYFSEDVKKIDCSFEEPTYYPDVPPEEEEDHSDVEIPEYDYDLLSKVSLDKELMENTSWNGYMIVNQGNGDTEYVHEGSDGYDREIYLVFYQDGSAEFGYDGECYEFTWACEGDDSVYLEGDDGWMYAYLYESGEDENSRFWLMVQYSEELIWFY